MDFKKLTRKLINIWQPINTPIDPAAAFQSLSYSQEGEDRVLSRFLENKTNGFYIDIGAHHSFRFSNTYLFYRQGWTGINIDAMPGSMEPFKSLRPNDINLEIPISNQKQVLTYHIFNEPALNTFSKDEAKKKDGLRNYKIIDRVELNTFPLSEVLDKYLPENQDIDFMSIDVEGLDFEVLQSNNWNKYRPEMVLIESLRSSLDNIKDNEVYTFLMEKEYSLVAKTFNTLFFKKVK